MTDDPVRRIVDRMTVLSDRNMAAAAKIVRVWATPDPAVPDKSARPRVRVATSGVSDPTAGHTTSATTVRLQLLHTLIGIVTDLLELVEDRTYIELDPAHLAALAGLRDVKPDDRPVDVDTVGTVLTVHTAAFDAVRRYVHRLTQDPRGFDTAESILLHLDERQFEASVRPLAHRLPALARRAETAIVQPAHPDAGMHQRCECPDDCCRSCTDPVVNRRGKRLSDRCQRRIRRAKGREKEQTR